LREVHAAHAALAEDVENLVAVGENLADEGIGHWSILLDGRRLVDATRRQYFVHMEVLVARQPVFDRQDQLYGYDLIMRSRSQTAYPADTPPEQLVADTFLGIGIDRVTEGR